MAKLPFPQFLSRYGIKLLFTATPDVVPGTIIDKRKKGFFGIGTLKQVLGGGPAKWATKLQPGNLVYGTIERALSLKGKASLNEFGVAISGGLRRARSVTFEITGVKVRTFKTQSMITISPALHKLRKSNKQLWKMVNNNWIADYVYYASEATVKFFVNGGVNLKADIQNRLKVSGEAGVQWKSNRSFTITNNQEVPFGFSGWKV